jgi:hypothetical protein
MLRDVPLPGVVAGDVAVDGTGVGRVAIPARAARILVPGT